MGTIDIFILYAESMDGTRIKHHKIGNTTYTVKSVFNRRSKINVLQKLNRLMDKDAEKISKMSGVLNQSVI